MPINLSGSLELTGSLVVSGSITATGPITVSGSIASASFAATASSADNLLVRNTLTAQTLVVQTITSSVDFVTGSTRFGSVIGNTHVFTGSMSVSGSGTFTDALNGTSANFSDLVTINKAASLSSLTIKSSSSTTGLQLYLFGLNATLSNQDNGSLAFQTNGTDRLTIASNGAATFSGSLTTGGKITANGGGLLLDLNGGSDTFARVTGNRGNGDNLHVANIEFYNSFSTRSVGEVRGITGVGGTQSNSGQLAFYTNDNGTYAERMRITSSGNVGIGTSSPSVVFNVSDPDHGIGIAYRGSSALPSIAGLFTDTGVSGGSGYGDLLVKARTDYGGFYGINFYTAVSDNTPVLRMRIQSDGVLNLPYGQIQFPASQNASANANTLDDYEEGSFTPVVIGSDTVGTASYNANQGRYTKVGRIVTFNLYVDWANGTGTGALRISGLPFTANDAFVYPAVTIGETGGISASANNIMTARINPSSNQVFISQYPVGGGVASSVNYDSAGYFVLAGTYYV
jgi:hypothetical protein